MKVQSSFIHHLGLCLLGWVLTCSLLQAAIINSGFETTTGWNSGTSGSFGVDRISSSFAGLPTEGSSVGRIFSGSGSTISTGQFGRWTQNVDLTSVGTLTFDAGILTLFQSPSAQSNTLHSFLEARVLIGSTIVWSSNLGGTFLNQAIDTSGFSGFSLLTVTLHAISNSNGENTPRISSSWFLVDNFRESAGSPVPVPAAFWLFGVGLVSLLGLRR